MKTKTMLIMLFLALWVFTVTGCKKVVMLNIDPTNYQMTVGEEVILKPVITNHAGNHPIEYFIENPQIVSITGNIVKAISPGITTVQAKIKEHEKANITLTFEVSATPVLTILGESMVEIGKTIVLQANVNGEKPEAIDWKSQSPEIATINSSGVVTGVRQGVAVIQAVVGPLKTTVEIAVLGADTVPPTIAIDTQQTSQNVTINYNVPFDPLWGIQATDDRDGDITAKIEVIGTVNPHRMGKYTLTYSVQDAAGNSAVSLTRHIEVIWDYGVTFIGHAGSYSGIMNTEEAFIKGVTEHGYQALECDVKQTKDGVFVTCHDDTFAGLPLAATNWNDIKDVTTTVTRGGIEYKSKICTFERYLEICKTYQVIAVVELKASAGITNNDTSRMKALLEVIEAKDMVDQVIFLGSQYKCLEWTRNNGYEQIPCQYLVNSCESEAVLQRCIDYNYDLSFNIAYSNSQEWIERYQELGLKVSCWTFNQYTDAKELQRWIDLGVDYVTCDVLRPYEVNLPEKKAELDLPVYTVIFQDYDGTVIKTAQVKEGRKVVSPVDPARVGYTFLGWDEDFTAVKENMTITAQYKIVVYQITYIENLVVLREEIWVDKSAFVNELYTDWFHWMESKVGIVDGLSKSGSQYTFVRNKTTATWSSIEELKNMDIYIFEKTLSNVAYKPVQRVNQQPVEPEIDQQFFLNTEPYRTKYRQLDSYLLNCCLTSYTSYDTTYTPTSAGKIQIWFRFHQWQKGIVIPVFDTLPLKFVSKKVEGVEVTLPTTPVTYTVLDVMTLPLPVVSGATFIGWYDNQACIGEAITNIGAGSTGDITLYAKWEIISSTFIK